MVWTEKFIPWGNLIVYVKESLRKTNVAEHIKWNFEVKLVNMILRVQAFIFSWDDILLKHSLNQYFSDSACVKKKNWMITYYNRNQLALSLPGIESNSVLCDQKCSLVCSRKVRGSLQRRKDVSFRTLAWCVGAVPANTHTQTRTHPRTRWWLRGRRTLSLESILSFTEALQHVILISF